MSSVGAQARVRGTDILRAELRKIVTLPAIRWSLLAAVALNCVLTAAEVAGVRIATGATGVGVREVGHLALAPGYGIVAIAVFAAASEYQSGQVRVSLLAVPRRRRLFGAKLTAAITTAGTASALSVLPATVGPHRLDAVHAAAWAGACVGLALTGFALALVARSALLAFALVTVAALGDWTGLLPAAVASYLPHGIALAALEMSPFWQTAPGVAFFALAAWGVALLTAAGLVFTRRDA